MTINLNDAEAMIQDIMALDLEYKLTIAYRIDCECSPYFIGRRELLIPEVIKQAKEQNADPIDVFATFARAVHARHANDISNSKEK